MCSSCFVASGCSLLPSSSSAVVGDGVSFSLLSSSTEYKHDRNRSRFDVRKALSNSNGISPVVYGSKYKACSILKGSIRVVSFLFLRDIARYVAGLKTGNARFRKPASEAANDAVDDDADDDNNDAVAPVEPRRGNDDMNELVIKEGVTKGDEKYLAFADDDDDEDAPVVVVVVVMAVLLRGGKDTVSRRVLVGVLLPPSTAVAVREDTRVVPVPAAAAVAAAVLCW